MTIDVNNIHGRAMLINLNISQWSARKTDKRAANEVTAQHGAKTSKASFYKPLVEGGELERIKTAATQARTEHYRRTLPWSDNGPRILSNVGYLDYMAAIQQLKAEFQKAVAEFVMQYPLLRQEAKRNLGTLFNDADYPDVSNIAGKFRFDVSVLPLPKGDDFRCDLGVDDVRRIQQEIEANTRDALHDSMLDAFDRVAKVVEAYIDRLADPKTVFRDSLVQNARDLAEVLPSLNIAGDAKLDGITTRLKDKLCSFEPDDLRKDEGARRKAYNEAMEMHKDLISFFGGAQ
ncbi:hypothetical protein D3C81_895210 [compost metagenome]